jgi:hypothetical protein
MNTKLFLALILGTLAFLSQTRAYCATPQPNAEKKQITLKDFVALCKNPSNFATAPQNIVIRCDYREEFWRPETPKNRFHKPSGEFS